MRAAPLLLVAALGAPWVGVADAALARALEPVGLGADEARALLAEIR